MDVNLTAFKNKRKTKYLYEVFYIYRRFGLTGNHQGSTLSLIMSSKNIFECKIKKIETIFNVFSFSFVFFFVSFTPPLYIYIYIYIYSGLQQDAYSLRSVAVLSPKGP